MLFRDYLACTADPGSLRPDDSLRVGSDEKGGCIVNGLIPMPVDRVSSLMPRRDSLGVFDEGGRALGELLTCRGESFSIPAFSAGYLSAYLFETHAADYGAEGRFERDYFLLRWDREQEYVAQYMKTAGVWGGFQHAGATKLDDSVTSAAPIMAVSGMSLSSDIQIEIVTRSILQPFAFERYLKLYHLLELRFDQDVVQRIRGLGENLKGIGQILSSYDNNELVRLKQIISKSRNPEVVVGCMQAVTSDTRWHPHIREIFFQFGKAGNPLADKEDEFLDLISSGGFTLKGLLPLAGRIPKGPSSPIQKQKFEAFCLELAAYWIYRVRSSIAHSRIGEYVMRSEDEEFVVHFAEVLLRAILCQTL